MRRISQDPPLCPSQAWGSQFLSSAQIHALDPYFKIKMANEECILELNGKTREVQIKCCNGTHRIIFDLRKFMGTKSVKGERQRLLKSQ